MDFNPSDAADQTTAKKVLPEGTYTLRAREAEERVSAKGNPMIAVEFEVSGHPGVIVREFLVATPAAMFKIKNFCDAAGLMAEFNNGRLTEDVVRGTVVDARLTIEGGGEYADKNRVEEYLRSNRSTERAMGGHMPQATTAAAPHTPVHEDDIPF